MAEGLIPFSRVIERVRKLANDYPDRVVECQYFDNGGAPECIFGTVLHELGCYLNVTTEDDVEVAWEVRGPTGVPVVNDGESISDAHWIAAGVAEPTKDQAGWAVNVQDTQDNNLAWGFAVGSVDEDFKRRGIAV
ncbi:hypothetical protein [Mycobacteroides abscessus]|uniref:hypothetical protein n=1 Tax=Mycobacteroides abscessus TaxID=36809 RepID=UPI000D3E92C7|nr:hypothetical protein [Mycobacteroides abscessus]PVB19776.1 hypothetical protein DDJ40_08450 [Mycobacteroides abscessus]RIU40378.1 hypothetical protein D2E83_11455 [Mycobacteroides abscessus]